MIKQRCPHCGSFDTVNKGLSTSNPIGEDKVVMQETHFCNDCTTDIDIQYVIGKDYFKDLYAGRIQACINDVMQFDMDHNIMHENEHNMTNLMYNALALAGEAGEVANVAKKIWRDGTSPELIRHLGEECVDMVIYMVKLLEVAEIDFDKAWIAKHAELYERWKNKKTHVRQVNISEEAK